MKDYFIRLLNFNNWANQSIANCLKENNIDSEKMMRIMSHIALAQHNWYYRVIRQQQDVPVWEMLSLADICAQLDENGHKWNALIEGTDAANLADLLPYCNLKGEPQINTLQDILAHAVNHSTYHRGQVIILIREAGYTPPTTDFIYYARLFS